MNAFCTLDEAVSAAKIRFRREIEQALATWRNARYDGRFPMISVNGPGGCGKDQTCCYISRGAGWGAVDLGQFAVSNAVKEMIGWCLNIDPDQAYMQRRDHRTYWFEWCNLFRKEDPAILAKLAMQDRGLVSGIRAREEFEACRDQQVFDIAVWIDRPGIKAEHHTLEIGQSDCDYTILNHGSLVALKKEVSKFLDKFGILKEGSI
jgi:hypothetical protein